MSSLIALAIPWLGNKIPFTPPLVAQMSVEGSSSVRGVVSQSLSACVLRLLATDSEATALLKKQHPLYKGSSRHSSPDHIDSESRDRFFSSDWFLLLTGHPTDFSWPHHQLGRKILFFFSFESIIRSYRDFWLVYKSWMKRSRSVTECCVLIPSSPEPIVSFWLPVLFDACFRTKL